MENNTEGKYKTISIDLIEDPEITMRSEITHESLEELAKSIKQVGLIEPIVVKKKGDKYEVIAGHRRLLACRIAELFFIPCRVVDVNDEMLETLKVHENLYRQDVNVVEEAHFIDKAMEKLKIDVEKMAELIGKSRTYVQSRLAILNYPDFLYEALKNNKINFSVARKLAQIDDIKTLQQYVEYASDNGITEDVATEWVRRWKTEKLAINGETPQPIETQPEIKNQPVLKVVCGLCGQELALKDAKVFYVHHECYRKVNS